MNGAQPALFPEPVGDDLPEDTCGKTSPYTGLLGEYFFQYWLLREMGLKSQRIDGSFDYGVEVGSRYLRVEVKSTHTEDRHRYCFSASRVREENVVDRQRVRRSTALTPEDCDIIALVAHDLEKIAFCLPPGDSSKVIARSVFLDQNNGRRTWEYCLRRLLDSERR